MTCYLKFLNILFAGRPASLGRPAAHLNTIAGVSAWISGSFAEKNRSDLQPGDESDRRATKGPSDADYHARRRRLKSGSECDVGPHAITFPRNETVRSAHLLDGEHYLASRLVFQEDLTDLQFAAASSRICSPPIRSLTIAAPNHDAHVRSSQIRPENWSIQEVRGPPKVARVFDVSTRRGTAGGRMKSQADILPRRASGGRRRAMRTIPC
jgi:hypothetical protein